MPRNRKAIDLTLEGAASIFSTQEERDTAEGIREIAIDKLDNFENHPFQVRDDGEMDNLVKSIEEVGILVPVQVRPKGDRFELISGHRRRKAAERAGLKTIPAIVRDLSDDEAVIAMVDSNLQRERILPSEKGFAYRMKLEALKRQGARSDLTSDPLGQKLAKPTSVELIAEESGDSKTQVQRYIRLTYLDKMLLDYVDDGKIGMRPAVELSYLNDEEQRALCGAMVAYQCTPSHAQAIKLRRYSSKGDLTPVVIQSILEEQKPNQIEQIRIPKRSIARFFKKGESPAAIEARIIKALELLDEVERRGYDAKRAQSQAVMNE